MDEYIKEIRNAFEYEPDINNPNVKIAERQPDNTLFFIYPNPAQHYFDMEISGYKEKVDITVFDITGKEIIKEVIASGSIGEKTKRINISSLKNGIYFVKIADGNSAEVQKLIVK